MRYSFNSNQIEILNILAFDSEITIDDVQNSQVIKESLTFPIERLEFEDVTRKKFLFWTTTNIMWIKSSLIFSNVKSFHISLIEKSQSYNYSISTIELKSPTLIEIFTNEGLKISIAFIKDPSIILLDIEKSDRNSISIFGSKGLTKDEWDSFSKENDYIPEF